MATLKYHKIYIAKESFERRFIVDFGKGKVANLPSDTKLSIIYKYALMAEKAKGKK